MQDGELLGFYKLNAKKMSVKGEFFVRLCLLVGVCLLYNPTPKCDTFIRHIKKQIKLPLGARPRGGSVPKLEITRT